MILIWLGFDFGLGFGLGLDRLEKEKFGERFDRNGFTSDATTFDQLDCLSTDNLQRLQLTWPENGWDSNLLLTDLSLSGFGEKPVVLL